MIEERYDLAIGRIGRIGGEESVKLPFRKFFQKNSNFLGLLPTILKNLPHFYIQTFVRTPIY